MDAGKNFYDGGWNARVSDEPFTTASSRSWQDGWNDCDGAPEADRTPMGDPPSKVLMTEAQIKHLVDRFLGWKLPKDFSPDAGISYARPNYAPEIDAAPSGTNLFDATQTDAMVRYMIEGLPAPINPDAAPIPTLSAEADDAPYSKELARDRWPGLRVIEVDNLRRFSNAVHAFAHATGCPAGGDVIAWLHRYQAPPSAEAGEVVERLRSYTSQRTAMNHPYLWGLLRDAITEIERLSASAAEVRNAGLEEAATVAEGMPERVLCMWDRPGSAPGNGYAEIKGQRIIAQNIRALRSLHAPALAAKTGD